jgi:hypothetical protein
MRQRSTEEAYCLRLRNTRGAVIRRIYGVDQDASSEVAQFSDQ